MRHLTAFGLLLATALPAQAQAQMITITPEQIGQIFCIGSQGNDMAPVEALLTPDLSVEIANAWARNAGFLDEHPGEKPPLGDGLPWHSWPDYADGCAVDVVEINADTAYVPIQFSFTADPMADYQDVLVLRQVPSESGGDTPVWRINDIMLVDGQSFRGMLNGVDTP